MARSLLSEKKKVLAHLTLNFIEHIPDWSINSAKLVSMYN